MRDNYIVEKCSVVMRLHFFNMSTARICALTDNRKNMSLPQVILHFKKLAFYSALWVSLCQKALMLEYTQMT